MTKASPFRHADADESAGFLLWKITALWQQKLAQALDMFGITQTQYALLASLRWFEEKGLPTHQSSLAAHTKIDKMTVSKSIRKLEASGLIKRAPSSIDNRSTDVKFTLAGKKLIERAISAIEDIDDIFFSHLGDSRLSEYKILTKLLISSNDA
ncbi:MAG: MarR family winged helix-turn-helix transcriptional regulator [Gammaproteobacteria bacterium]|nr:MarR family winged helix-turn-helix transcriptional regulator [Gammaproteobacteria bacterium]